MFKRIMTIVGPKGSRYIKRTETHLGITDNLELATDYFKVSTDHEELLANDFVYLNEVIPADVSIEVSDIKVEITIEKVDLASTLVDTKIRTAAIAKLTPREIEVLGLQSEAVFAKLSKSADKSNKIDLFRSKPVIKISEAAYTNQLGSVEISNRSRW